MERKLNRLFKIVGEIQNLIYKNDESFQHYFFDKEYLTESSYVADVQLGDYMIYCRLGDKTGLLRKAEIDYLDFCQWNDTLKNNKR